MSFSYKKGEFDGCFNRFDRPVEESRPKPTGAGRPTRFQSLLCLNSVRKDPPSIYVAQRLVLFLYTRFEY